MKMMARRAVRVFFITLLAVGASVPAFATQKHDKELTLTTLSSRPDMVTAGNALIRVDVPSGVAMQDIVVTRNGDDITAVFQRDDVARTLTGLVDGLEVGKNRLVARSKGKDHARRGELTLVNHPKEGPVFSGPYQTPFACQAHTFTVPVIGVKLAPTSEPECTVPTRVDYFYRTTAAAIAYKAWPVGATSYPADLARTTISLGVATPLEVPYIVRMETGSANRGIYHLWMLHDPLTEPEPNFHTRARGWNGRLFYMFGVGCSGTLEQPGGWYRQGTSAGVTSTPTSGTLLPAVDYPLSRGYGVGLSSLTVGNNNCNDVVSAETMMTVKERFIEAFGPPKFTIGFGLSGGAIQQHKIADNYPGLLDGIVPGGSFPEGVGRGVTGDAALLQNYFSRLASVPWTDEEKRAVTGFGLLATLTAGEVLPLNPAPPPERLINLDPRAYCPNTLPVEERYRPATESDPGNPDGVRCDIFSAYRNIFGVDPETGFVRRLIDNVGVQYGLGALNAGRITVEQFLDLNEKIGGLDDDANFVPDRTVADRVAMKAAYRTGRMTHGGGGLASIPIIDYRAYSDDQMNEAVTPPIPIGDNHLRYNSFSMRERLVKANGHADNQVMLVDDLRTPSGAAKGVVNLYTPVRSPLLAFAFGQMDRWLENLSQDTSDDPAIDKVRRAKPATLLEGCKVRGLDQTFIPEIQTTDTSSVCGALYPVNSFPRGVAGESIANDIIKCRRTRVDFDDYQVAFSSEQRARLKAIFHGGVCDWSKRGVGQGPPKGTWLSFDDHHDDEQHD